MPVETSPISKNYAVEELCNAAPEDIQPVLRGFLVGLNRGFSLSELIEINNKDIKANPKDPDRETAQKYADRAVKFLEQKGIK